MACASTGFPGDHGRPRLSTAGRPAAARAGRGGRRAAAGSATGTTRSSRCGRRSRSSAPRRRRAGRPLRRRPADDAERRGAEPAEGRAAGGPPARRVARPPEGPPSRSGMDVRHPCFAGGDRARELLERVREALGGHDAVHQVGREGRPRHLPVPARRPRRRPDDRTGRAPRASARSDGSSVPQTRLDAEERHELGAGRRAGERRRGGCELRPSASSSSGSPGATRSAERADLAVQREQERTAAAWPWAAPRIATASPPAVTSDGRGGGTATATAGPRGRRRARPRRKISRVRRRARKQAQRSRRLPRTRRPASRRRPCRAACCRESCGRRCRDAAREPGGERRLDRGERQEEWPRGRGPRRRGRAACRAPRARALRRGRPQGASHPPALVSSTPPPSSALSPAPTRRAVAGQASGAAGTAPTLASRRAPNGSSASVAGPSGRGRRGNRWRRRRRRAGPGPPACAAPRRSRTGPVLTCVVAACCWRAALFRPRPGGTTAGRPARRRRAGPPAPAPQGQRAAPSPDPRVPVAAASRGVAGSARRAPRRPPCATSPRRGPARTAPPRARAANARPTRRSKSSSGPWQRSHRT